MSIPKKILSLLTYIGRNFESAVKDSVSGLQFLAMQPFNDLARVRKKNVSAKERLLGLLLLPLKLVLAAVSVIIRVVISPAELGVNLFNRKMKEILWTIPWIIGFVSLCGFLVLGWYNQGSRLISLRRSAIQSLNAGDNALAETQFAQLIQWSDPVEQADVLQWYLALQATNQKEKANEVLRKLAPPMDTNPGYAPAHQLVSIGIVRQMKRPANPLVLKTLKWHLDCGGETRSPEIQRCWAEYYLGINDVDSAIRHMKIAAELKPEYLVMVADAYRFKGQREAQIEALGKAKIYHQELLKKQPLVHKQRILYARILKDLGQLESAERVLLAGVALKDDPEIRSGCAGFYLMLFNEAGPGSEFKKRFELLSKSLEHNENHPPTYEALIQLYRSEASPSDKKEIVSVLKSSIDSDEPVALAHFALSNILWTENNFLEAENQMEMAFKLDSRFAIVANNLAWLLAHSHQPDLERAFQLSQMAVAKFPTNGRVRDTLATILMKQEKFDQALAEFQLALPTVTTKKSVHEKMATIYRKIGKVELAKQHELHASTMID